MSKRQKIILISILLLIGLIISRLAPGFLLQWRFRVAIFGVLSFLATIWALFDEDFSGIEWLSLPILPVMYSVGAILVFPMIPASFDSFLSFPISVDASYLLALIIKILFLVIYISGFYASVLTANIYNVAAVRSIQLLRVAHSIGFLMSVATALLFYMAIFSLHLSSSVNLLITFLVALPLSFQAIWSVSLEQKIGRGTKVYSLVIPYIMAQTAWILSFWPVSGSIVAIFLTALFYELIGIVQYYFGEKLNKKIINEFILVALVVFIITLLTAQWGM